MTVAPQRIYIMTPEQRARYDIPESDPTQYAIGGVRGDGSDYHWHRSESIAETIATALLQAGEAQAEAARVSALARSYMDTVADAMVLVSDETLVECCRVGILARLDWAEQWFTRSHRLKAVWPPERAADLQRVRDVVIASEHSGELMRWLMICERHRDDWADQLMRATGVTAGHGR